MRNKTSGLVNRKYNFWKEGRNWKVLRISPSTILFICSFLGVRGWVLGDYSWLCAWDAPGSLSRFMWCLRLNQVICIHKLTHAATPFFKAIIWTWLNKYQFLNQGDWWKKCFKKENIKGSQRDWTVGRTLALDTPGLDWISSNPDGPLWATRTDPWVQSQE